MKIIDIIDQFISGEWGEEKYSDSTPYKVACIRGADISPIDNGDFTHIPTRYISKRSFEGKRLQAGDIVVEKSGGSPTQSTGRVAFISQNLIDSVGSVVCSNFCVAFRVTKNWNPLYIFYYLQFIYNKGVFFNFEGKTSGLKNLQLEAAYKAIPIKDIDEVHQAQIVAILDSIHRKLTINRAINQNLEALVKQLYDYWFVQFDFPDEKGQPYKSSGGKMVWNEKLKREIPEGWSVSKVEEIAQTYSGGTPNSSNEEYYKNGTIPWINSGELNNPIITSTSNYITQLGLDNSSAKLYPINTILVALYGATAGKVSLLTFSASSNQAICGVIPSKSFLVIYLYYALSSMYERFVTLSTGSARDNISQATVKITQVIVPTGAILAKFDNIANGIIQDIIYNQRGNESLITQRDELLPLLMNGQVSLNSDLSND